jgi:hypothetical protein
MMPSLHLDRDSLVLTASRATQSFCSFQPHHVSSAW